MNELVNAGIAGLAARLAQGETTSRAATEGYLARISQYDGKLNSFLCVTDQDALAQADASDARRKAGRAVGPFDGIPIAIKDNIDVEGVPTTAGIGARRGRVATRDAPVIAKLKAAGAVILGKLNLHEGAHGATTANEAYGFCHNPFRHDFTPGGSSGGSAVALAAGLCAGALGTDTLGSVRIPASFCGIVGLKPTQGLVSTDGVVPLCRALDHVGPMARTVEDTAFLLAAMTGRPAPAVTQLDILHGFTLGRLPDLEALADAVHPDIARAYEAALATLADLGATIVDAPLTDFVHNEIRTKALLMIEADVAEVHVADLARDPEGFTQDFRDGVAFGRRQTQEKIAAAAEAVRAVAPLVRRALTGVDALVTPTTPCPAFPFRAPLAKGVSAFTAFANYAGVPAVSVPMGATQDGLPLGLQIVTAPGKDARALALAATYARATGWRMTPEI